MEKNRYTKTTFYKGLKMTKIRFHLAVVLGVTSALLCSFNTTVKAGEIAIKSGEKMAFMGDSITAAGWGSKTGYVRLVISGLEANGIKVTPIPAGISGHKSNQMLARLDKDVISKKPDWMSLSCGVNDVWHGARGVNLEDYKKNITEIVDKCQTAGIKVMILTSTMIRETPDNAENKKLADYNAFLLQLAKEKNLPIADLNADMQAIVIEHQKATKSKGNFLTRDGVHMNPFGDMMMAKGILRAFGMDDAQIKTAEAAWDKLTVPQNFQADISFAQFKKFQQSSPEKQKEIMTKVKKAATDVMVEYIDK